MPPQTRPREAERDTQCLAAAVSRTTVADASSCGTALMPHPVRAVIEHG